MVQEVTGHIVYQVCGLIYFVPLLNGQLEYCSHSSEKLVWWVEITTLLIERSTINGMLLASQPGPVAPVFTPVAHGNFQNDQAYVKRR